MVRCALQRRDDARVVEPLLAGQSGQPEQPFRTAPLEHRVVRQIMQAGMRQVGSAPRARCASARTAPPAPIPLASASRNSRAVMTPWGITSALECKRLSVPLPIPISPFSSDSIQAEYSRARRSSREHHAEFASVAQRADASPLNMCLGGFVSAWKNVRRRDAGASPRAPPARSKLVSEKGTCSAARNSSRSRSAYAAIGWSVARKTSARWVRKPLSHRALGPNASMDSSISADSRLAATLTARIMRPSSKTRKANGSRTEL